MFGCSGRNGPTSYMPYMEGFALPATDAHYIQRYMSGLPSTTKFRVRPLNRSISSPDLPHATSSLVNQTVFRPIGVRRAPGAPPKSVLHNTDTPSKVGPQGIVFFDTQHETPPYLLGIDPNPFPPHTPTPCPTSLDNEDTEFMNVDMMDQMDVDIPSPTIDSQPPPIPSPPQPSSIPTLASLSRDNPLPDFPYAVSTPKVRRDSRVVLDELRKHKISPAQFFYTIMDRRNTEFERQQVAFYRNDSKFFIPILSLMWICLHSLFLSWLTPKALEICRSKVAKEFEKATPLMTFSKDQVTPEFLSTWNIQNMFSWKTADNTSAAAALDGSDIMPWWHSILEAATTSRDTARNKKRDGDLVSYTTHHRINTHISVRLVALSLLRSCMYDLVTRQCYSSCSAYSRGLRVHLNA